MENVTWGTPVLIMRRLLALLLFIYSFALASDTIEPIAGKRSFENFSGSENLDSLAVGEQFDDFAQMIQEVDLFPGDLADGFEASARELPPEHMISYETDEDLISFWANNYEFREYFRAFEPDNYCCNYEFTSVSSDGKTVKRVLEFDLNWPDVSQSKVPMSPLRIKIYKEFFHCLFSGQCGYLDLPSLVEHKLIDVSRPVLEKLFLVGTFQTNKTVFFTPLTERNLTFALLAFHQDCQHDFIHPAILRVLPENLVNFALKNGKTALHAAIERGNVDAVRSLLVKGADPNMQYLPKEGTAAMMAAKRGFRKMLRILAATKKCDPNIQLQYIYSLSKYFFDRKIPEALLIFANWPQITNERIKTMLMLAYNSKYEFGLECLKILLPFRQFEKVFLKELAESAFKGDKESFEAIIAAGYQPQRVFSYGSTNNTYLHLAIRQDHAHMIHTIMNAVDVNKEISFEGLVPIKLAIAKHRFISFYWIFQFLKASSPTFKNELEELLTFSVGCDFFRGVDLIVKEFDSLDEFRYNGYKLPIYLAKYGTFNTLRASLSNANFNPHLPDEKAGVALDSLKTWDVNKAELISEYFSLYDSRMQV